MTKLWLVTFSNGEEWHIFGDIGEVMLASYTYNGNRPDNPVDLPTIAFIRAYK